MKKIGDYEYSNTHAYITLGGVGAGVVYGFLTGKPMGAIVLMAVVGGMLGWGISTLVERPVRVEEQKQDEQ